ncbi:MAG: hypothetical protein KC457_35450, partial [Myxococcales bacterium]|nr:hypothetical protein [Myxococcales bacterium]
MSESSSAPLAIAGLVIGALAGGIVGWIAHSTTAEPRIVETEKVVQEDLSPEALAKMCEELNPDDRTRLLDSQSRVEELEKQLAEREAALAELKTQNETDETRRKAAAKKWKEMEAEIEQLKAERDAAVQERDELRTELKQTLVELDRQIRRAETFKAKAKEFKKKSTENDWAAFLAQAKVELCDKGTRKRHEKCHEAVEEALNVAIQDKFETCIDGYQARPVLAQAEKGETLPT